MNFPQIEALGGREPSQGYCEEESQPAQGVQKHDCHKCRYVQFLWVTPDPWCRGGNHTSQLPRTPGGRGWSLGGPQVSVHHLMDLPTARGVFRMSPTPGVTKHGHCSVQGRLVRAGWWASFVLLTAQHMRPIQYFFFLTRAPWMLFLVLLSQLYTFKASLPVWTSRGIAIVPTAEGSSRTRCRGQALPSVYPSGCKPQSRPAVMDCLLWLYPITPKMIFHEDKEEFISSYDPQCMW